MWLSTDCDVNQSRSCVASDFMRNASNGQCKTGAVEWQVAVTNREKRILENAIIELLFDNHLGFLQWMQFNFFAELPMALSCQESLDKYRYFLPTKWFVSTCKQLRRLFLIILFFVKKNCWLLFILNKNMLIN